MHAPLCESGAYLSDLLDDLVLGRDSRPLVRHGCRVFSFVGSVAGKRTETSERQARVTVAAGVERPEERASKETAGGERREESPTTLPCGSTLLPELLTDAAR
jgi:hypothetical protein